MKNALLLFITIACIIKSYSQENAGIQLVGDTLISTTGYKITAEQEINLGTGATPDGDFKFVRRNSSGFGTALLMTDNNGYNKQQLSLPRNMAGHKGKVVKIVKRGNKKIGITYQPLISIGGARYEIDVDNAIASGEMVVPEEYKPKQKATVVEVKQQTSVADELTKLKKLLDDKVLTQAEYDEQKKKLLNRKE